MNTVQSVIDGTEMNEKKRWRLNRYIELIANAGLELEQIADNQSNAFGFADAFIQGGIKKIYGQGAEYRELMGQLYREEKEMFPRKK